MKKIIYPLIGVVIAGLVCNILFWGVGRIAVAFDIRLYNSEAEASRNFLIFLVLFSVFIFAGLITGYRMAKKREKIRDKVTQLAARMDGL